MFLLLYSLFWVPTSLGTKLSITKETIISLNRTFRNLNLKYMALWKYSCGLGGQDEMLLKQKLMRVSQVQEAKRRTFQVGGVDA